MRIYLASRFGRQEELLAIKSRLQGLGHEVTSRWLHEESSKDTDENARRSWAKNDYQDVLLADVMMNFTEAPPSGCGRGGRHVEFGLAAAWGKRLVVVGHRENVFHWLPQVEFYGTLDEAIAAL